jgi:hypothetical protein
MNVPIAICIGLSTLLTFYTLGTIPRTDRGPACFDGHRRFPLLAIPFFILAGILMGEGGMARRVLIHFAASMVGWLTGGLAYCQYADLHECSDRFRVRRPRRFFVGRRIHDSGDEQTGVFAGRLMSQ